MPKKSGKALAKMTEEERLIYLEQQRLAEEEAKKKKEDLLAQYLKDKLAKEEAATKFNANKINQQWRAIMREAKARQLKKEFEILSQTFERIVDRKDSVIKSLVKDLQEAEEQYSTALRHHLQDLQQLLSFQRRRLEDLEGEYDKELDIIRLEYEREIAALEEKHKNTMTELSDVMIGMEQQFEERESEARAEFQSLRDEIKNKNLEERQSLRVQLESQVEELVDEFNAAKRNYTAATEDRKKAFEQLKEKDEKSAHEIEQQMTKIQRITDQINQLKSKIGLNAKESEERNRLLKEQRDHMSSQFQSLKLQLNAQRERQRQMLCRLTVQSNEALKHLRSVAEQGERLLRLAELGRKYECEAEKVLPFYTCSLSPEELEDVRAALTEGMQEPLADKVNEYNALDGFWQRFNKVYLEKLALDKERSLLGAENQQLRALLKQYLDGISVNEEVIASANPLFVVNFKSNVK